LLLKDYETSVIRLKIPIQGSTLDCGIYVIYYSYCITSGIEMKQEHLFLKNGRAIIHGWIVNNNAELTCIYLLLYLFMIKNIPQSSQ